MSIQRRSDVVCHLGNLLNFSTDNLNSTSSVLKKSVINRDSTSTICFSPKCFK